MLSEVTAAAQSQKPVSAFYWRSIRQQKGTDLGHDAIVGSNHQDDDVSDRRASSAHGGEGSMTRRVQKCGCGLQRQRKPELTLCRHGDQHPT